MAEHSKIELVDHNFNPQNDCDEIALSWNRKAEIQFRFEKRRPRVFLASLTDIFDNGVPNSLRQNLMSLIARTPNIDWLLLTKRIGSAKRMMDDASMHDGLLLNANDQPRELPNIWLGATICNQEEADRDIPKLLAVPAAKHFLNIDPLLGQVDLETAWFFVR